MLRLVSIPVRGDQGSASPVGEMLVRFQEAKQEQGLRSAYPSPLGLWPQHQRCESIAQATRRLSSKSGYEPSSHVGEDMIYGFIRPETVRNAFERSILLEMLEHVTGLNC